MTDYDLAVVGGGPAGLSAAIKAASEGLSVILLNAEATCGGRSKHSAAIENYYGFPVVSGQQLANRAVKQAKQFGVDIRCNAPVTDIALDGDDKLVFFTGGVARVKAVVVACGLHFKKEFPSDCVIYNANKNYARYYAGKRVLIVGGGNSAGQAALHWCKYADVTIAAKYPLTQTMATYLTDRIAAAGLRVLEAGLESVNQTACTLSNGTTETYDAVLVFTGAAPSTDFAAAVCERDKEGFLTRGKVPGVFIAGDARQGSLGGIAAAVGEGSETIPKVRTYLSMR